MSTLRTGGRLWPPLPLLLGFLFIVMLFGGYRSCRETAATHLVERWAPRPPGSGRPGLVAVAGVPLSQAPSYVQRVIQHLRTVSHWQPLRGFKGGRIFRNLRGTLPRGRAYYEYDVHPFRAGVNRGPERLVVDETKQFFYYTRDHYTTFTQIRLP